MIYGYCRISTNKQDITRQIKNIKASYPNATIIEEIHSGKKVNNRIKLMRLLDSLEENDTVVVDEVSRLSRTSDEGMKIYKNLFENNINFISLKEPGVNTQYIKNLIKSYSSTNQVQTPDPFLNNMLSSIQNSYNEMAYNMAMDYVKTFFDFAQAERDLLSQRTREGMRVAKENGKRIGNPKGIKLTTKKSIQSKDVIYHKSKDFNGNLKDADVIKLCQISRNTYYKYKKELKEQIDKLNCQSWEEFLQTLN